MRSVIVSALILMPFLQAAVFAAPDDPTIQVGNLKVPFNDVMRKVDAAQRSGEWKTEGWDYSFATKYVQAVIDGIQRQTKVADLDFPILGQQVIIATPFNLKRLPQNSVVVVHNQDFGHITDSIVLSTGVVRASKIENSIVIAQGAILVAYSKASALFAGHFVDVSHDQAELFGKIADDANAAVNSRSLLVSGSTINLGTAAGTICSAPTLVNIAHSRRVILVNSLCREISFARHTRSVDVKKELFIPKHHQFSWPDGLTSSQLIDNNRRPLLIYTFEGEELLMRPGKQFPARVVSRFPHLKGATLTLVADTFVLFTQQDGTFALHNFEPVDCKK